MTGLRRTLRLLAPDTVTSALIFASFMAGAILWAWLRIDPLGNGASPAARSTLLLVYSAPIVVPVGLVLRQLHREFSLTSSLGRGLALMALGAASWGLGNVGWFYYQTCSSWPVLACASGARIPFPSPADALYLGIYPLSAAGGFLVARALGLPTRYLAWGALAAVPLTIATLYVGLAPTRVASMTFGLGFLVSPDATPSQAALTAAYMVGDALLLVMAVMLLDRARRVTRGAFLYPLGLLVAGVGLLFAADMVFFHSLATGTYDELGLSSLLYAATLAAMPWAIHRFTISGRSVQIAHSVMSIDPWHDSARRIVERQARLFGDMARELAQETPGVRIEAGTPTLEAPHDQSLRNLASAFSGRLGPCGDRILRSVLNDVASNHPNGRELDSLIADLDTLGRIGRRDHWSDSVWLTPTVGSLVIGVLTGVAVLLMPPGHGGNHATAVAACAALAAGAFGHAAARSRRRIDRRRHQLAQANESLGSLLEAFDHARADERTRVAGEIHDFALQQLIGTLMHLERAAARAGADEPGPASSIADAADLVSGSIAGLRRIMDGLHPSSLMHGDIGAALAELGNQVAAAHSLRVEIDAPTVSELTLGQQLLVYRTTAELVSNAGKHSAASRVTIRARTCDSTIRISAQDDGMGFPEELDLLDQLPAHHGWGLQLLLEQVTREGGRLHLQSTPGEGTTIDVLIPIQKRALAS